MIGTTSGHKVPQADTREFVIMDLLQILDYESVINTYENL
jgi:hypothetical protein